MLTIKLIEIRCLNKTLNFKINLINMLIIVNRNFNDKRFKINFVIKIIFIKIINIHNNFVKVIHNKIINNRHINLIIDQSIISFNFRFKQILAI